MKKSFNLFVLILLLFPTYGQEIDLAPFPCDSLGGIDRRAYVDRNDPGLKACLEENMRKRTIAFQEDSLNVLMDLMWMYSVSFENQKVIDLKSQLIRSCVTLKDSIYVYNMMSYSYIGIEQYANARKELNEGLYIANRKGDKLLLFTLYLESLKQYRSINDSINLYKELEQLEELFPYADSLNLDQCSFYNIKATIYLDFGTDEQQKKSTKIAEKAVECYNGRDAKDQAAVAYEILANCYLNNKENGYLDRAEKATYNALGIYVAFNNRPMEGRMINLLGFIELDRGNINSAISYIKKSLAIAKEYNDLPFREDNLYKLGDAYAKQKKYKKAYEVSLELEQIKEQIESENNKTLFYNLEQQYKSKEKEQKIQLLNQEKTLNLQQRNLFVGLALFLLAMALLASYYFYRQRKLNNIITNQYTELQELNKFKDQLFSIIGHDLRNLVAKLNTDQRRLVRNTKKVENVSLHPLALKMGANTENLNGLVENLLFWGMKESEGFYLHREPLPLKKMAEQVAYNFQNEIEQKGLKIQYDIPDDLLVLSDDNILKMSIRNLLNNAIKFSNPNTSIRLEGLQVKDNPLLRIVDQGIGIPKEKLSILFDINPSKMSKGTQGETGTGLGLWLCKELLAKVDAQISATSKAGQDTVFTIEFPS